MSSLTLFDAPNFQPESETVEYKESWHQDNLKSLSAFANTRGGVLKIGVNDKGNVKGWNGTPKEQESISSQIVSALGIHPVRVEVEDYNNGRVLAISIQKSPAPVALRGRYYRRVGNSTRDVPESELARFLLERTGQSWDALSAPVSIEEISDSTIENFRSFSKERLTKIAYSDSIEIILRKLGLFTHEDLISRGALILFGKNPQKYYKVAQIQIGKFIDETTILDEELIEGNIFECLNKCIQIIRRYIYVSFEIPKDSSSGTGVEGLQRREIWSIPYEAIREALLNALAHRDYTRSASIQIRVYDDRILIQNPGGLMDGLSVLDLLHDPHESLRRNPFIAEVLYFAKLIERWGTGTLRMQSACRNQGIPDPVFESSDTFFRVTFFMKQYNTTEETIIQIIKSLGEVSRNDIADRLNQKPQTITNYLVKLKNNNIIMQTGKNKGAKYKFNDQYNLSGSVISENKIPKIKNVSNTPEKNEVLDIIKQKNEVSKSELVLILGADPVLISRILLKLKESNLIIQIGKNRGAKYRINTTP